MDFPESGCIAMLTSTSCVLAKQFLPGPLGYHLRLGDSGEGAVVVRLAVSSQFHAEFAVLVLVDVAYAGALVGPVCAVDVALVLLRGREAQVGDLHTGLVEADVVYLHAFRNGAVLAGPGVPMRRGQPSVDADLPVSFAALLAGVHDAITI